MSALGQARLFRWESVAEERVSDLLQRRVITGDRLMLLQVSLKKGCIVPKHSHHNEQMTYTLKGSLRVWIGESGEQETRVGAGDVLYVPANVPHKVEVLEDTLNVEVFSPPRQDLLPQQHRAHGQSEA